MEGELTREVLTDDVVIFVYDDGVCRCPVLSKSQATYDGSAHERSELERS